MSKRSIAGLAVVGLATATAVFFGVTASSASSVASQVRLGGASFSSLGAGSAMDETPGMESVTLLNYSYSSKSLKGYSVKDAAGNRVWMCKTVATNCTSNTLDDDADTVKNINDSDSWITMGARSQRTVNVEGRNDGPLLNNGGDTTYLLNSVGHVLSVFKYAASNPTS